MMMCLFLTSVKNSVITPNSLILIRRLYSKLWLRQKHMLQETEAVKGPGSFLLPFDNSTSSGVLNAVFFR